MPGLSGSRPGGSPGILSGKGCAVARTRTGRLRLGVGAAVGALALVGLALTTPAAAARDWSACLDGPTDTQAAFARAAEVSGVPQDVLLAVGYLESRWSQHAGAPSTSGGYGVMHLTEHAVEASGSAAKGDPARGLPARSGTLPLAAELTGADADRLRRDHVANICGGAAVLASYQPRTTAARPAAWSKAVALYAGTAAEDEAVRFARQVFDVLRTGATVSTDTGDTVTLAARPGADLDAAALESAGLLVPGVQEAECPATLDCEIIESEYRKTGPKATQYVNYDLADRPRDGLSIDYLLVHNTECTYETCVNLLKGPRFVSWHYTLRSEDGHVAQHVATRNVAAHAGNWYVNMHSVGFEHEGFAAQPGQWYTEAMYRSSADLVGYLAEKYDIPLDRAHVIGHDQVPTSTHWDPGPYWDWEHYMKLLDAPIRPDRRGKSDVWTVRPGFTDNQRALTGCTGAGSTCPTFGTNFTYLRTEPREDAPLVGGGTTGVSDDRARVKAGHQLLVVDRVGDWFKVWWNGQAGWVHNPEGDETLVPSQGEVVTPRGDTEVPVYARAYPEADAYAGTQIPYQGQPVTGVTIKPGQSYVVADKSVPTDYYYAKSYDDSIPDDHTVVTGQERYYQVWVGSRMGFVKATDVDVLPGG